MQRKVPAFLLPPRDHQESSPATTMLRKLRRWWCLQEFREGATLSRFIARDVRRDVLVVSTSRLRDGIITGRVRTTNVLYLSRRLIPPPEFEPPRELLVEHLWNWTGQSWGGLPDGTSLVERTHPPSVPKG